MRHFQTLICFIVCFAWRKTERLRWRLTAKFRLHFCSQAIFSLGHPAILHPRGLQQFTKLILSWDWKSIFVREVCWDFLYESIRASSMAVSIMHNEKTKLKKKIVIYQFHNLTTASKSILLLLFGVCLLPYCFPENLWHPGLIIYLEELLCTLYNGFVIIG
jgi:hypothetical protein